jgi:hypothetical protein
MLIVAISFAVIFLFRDVQILAVQGRRPLAVRLGTYTILLLTGMAVFASLMSSRPGWTDRRFALGAIFVQLSELIIGFALERYSLGRHYWIGCVLPSPAFLVALYALGFEAQIRLRNADPVATLAVVTAAWLLLVGGLVSTLCWMNNPWEDRKFASDFAMMTSCTALIFVPFGLS